MGTVSGEWLETCWRGYCRDRTSIAGRRGWSRSELLEVTERVWRAICSYLKGPQKECALDVPASELRDSQPGWGPGSSCCVRQNGEVAVALSCGQSRSRASLNRNNSYCPQCIFACACRPQMIAPASAQHPKLCPPWNVDMSWTVMFAINFRRIDVHNGNLDISENMAFFGLHIFAEPSVESSCRSGQFLCHVHG